MYQVGGNRSFLGYALWGDGERDILCCPRCGDSKQAAGEGYVVNSNDDYRAGWGGRGPLIVVPVDGECGHEWELCFGFHKGATAVFARWLPEDRG